MKLTENFQIFKLDLEKAVEPETKLPTSVGSQKKQENSRKKIVYRLQFISSCHLGTCGLPAEAINTLNTRLPHLPPEKSVFRSRSNS